MGVVPGQGINKLINWLKHAGTLCAAVIVVM